MVHVCAHVVNVGDIFKCCMHIGFKKVFKVNVIYLSRNSSSIGYFGIFIYRKYSNHCIFLF